MRSILCVLFGIAAVSSAAASQVVSVDLLDSAAEGILPPVGVACVDVMVDISDGDSWTAAGIRVVATGGATLRYAMDPNLEIWFPLTTPTTAFRHSTFVSEPRPRDSSARYNNGGAALAGRYSPTGPTEVATYTEFNVAWFASPPETIGSPTVDGAIFRVAINVPTIYQASSLAVFQGQTPPPHIFDVLLRCVTVDPTAPGIASATYDVPTLTGFDWGLGVVIPEPASIGLLAIAVGLQLSRRR